MSVVSCRTAEHCSKTTINSFSSFTSDWFVQLVKLVSETQETPPNSTFSSSQHLSTEKHPFVLSLSFSRLCNLLSKELPPSQRHHCKNMVSELNLAAYPVFIILDKVCCVRPCWSCMWSVMFSFLVFDRQTGFCVCHRLQFIVKLPELATSPHTPNSYHSHPSPSLKAQPVRGSSYCGHAHFSIMSSSACRKRKPLVQRETLEHSTRDSSLSSALHFLNEIPLPRSHRAVHGERGEEGGV